MIVLLEANIDRPTINSHDSALRTMEVDFDLVAMCRSVVTEREMANADGIDLRQKLRSMFLCHELLLVPPSVADDVRHLMRAVCAGSTNAIPKLVDELIGLGHQPDGDEPITDDWIVSEFGLRPCPDEAYDAVDFRDGSRVVFYRTFYRPSGQYVAAHNLVVTTRRDARSVMRMLQAFDANIQAADRPSGHDQHFGG